MVEIEIDLCTILFSLEILSWAVLTYAGSINLNKKKLNKSSLNIYTL